MVPWTSDKSFFSLYLHGHDFVGCQKMARRCRVSLLSFIAVVVVVRCCLFSPVPKWQASL